MGRKKVGGPQRLLHGLSKFDGKYPANKEGRVDIKNLTAILVEITKSDGEYRVREHDKQYFTKDEELREIISEINSRLFRSRDNNQEIDKVAAERIAAVTKKAKASHEDALRAKVEYAAVLQRLTESERRNAELTREVQSLREQMNLVRQGIMPKVS
ncbi:hypothetical protein [Leisingera daeponensis]|uniref:hypothetical protein n=1 Tax=Leisingera daeponensis TaxID=405746 RepID=UPI001C93FA53|nr:hypothetical protein [Leisingera daeponensis]MBY6058171.1 hypothetical protein [Leisingera daeponensis]